MRTELSIDPSDSEPAEAAARARELPGPLRSEAVLADLRARELVGASSLESFAVCSYVWFVEHELRVRAPRSGADPLAMGTIVHKTLKRLYGEPPGAGPLPRPADLGTWLERARELLGEEAERAGFEARDAVTRLAWRKMESAVDRFLRAESERETVLAPDPDLLEAGFGTEDAERGPLRLGETGLRGTIDRVDRAPDGRGLVRDYKLSRSAIAGAKLGPERRLQLQLYMAALRELWGIEPLGGVYHPLAGEDTRPRGLLRADELGGALAGEPLYRGNGDLVDDGAALDAEIAKAVEAATQITARMRAGEIGRNPYDPYLDEALGPSGHEDRCPSHCRYQTICRREHGAPPGHAVPDGEPPRAAVAPETAARGTSAEEPPPPPTAEQRKAIEARDRDVFLTAGAGSGKTRVLVDRFCAALLEDGVPLEQMLAFTFTEKAAGQLRDRIRAELEQRGRAAEATGEAWISTMHAFCRRLLAAHPAEAGLDPRFRVLDETEAERLARRSFEEALDELTASGESGDLDRAEELLRSYPEGREQLAGFVHRYEARKAARTGVDFDDLPRKAIELLKGDEAIRGTWSTRFRHIMVDELQDTDPLQVELLRLLQGPDTRLFMVGDALQAIYSFREADIELFHRERVLVGERGGELLELRDNFRSSPELVDAINALGRELFGEGFAALRAAAPAAAPRGSGPPAELLLVTQRDGEGIDELRHAEAELLADRLRELLDSGVQRDEIVVLLRALGAARIYERALARAGLNPHLIGARGYWLDQQVTDARAILGVIADPHDDFALLGTLASPACGASADALWLLRRAAGRAPIWTALERGFGEMASGNGAEGEEGRWLDAIPPADRERLHRFRGQLAELRAAAPALGLDALIERAIGALGYDLAVLSMPEGERRFANLRKLMQIAREFEAHEGRDLAAFREFTETEATHETRRAPSGVDVEGHDGVLVMSIHRAKGLEWPVVAVADLGRQRRHESSRDEELRLLHVAATRARERLILSGTAGSKLLEPGRAPRASDPPIVAAVRALGL